MMFPLAAVVPGATESLPLGQVPGPVIPLQRALWCISLITLLVVAASSPASAHPKGQVTPPKLVHFVEADVPTDAAKRTSDAVVDLWLTIDAKGLVTAATVKGSAGKAFDEAAVKAARQFRFKPARAADGKPIPVIVRFSYRFKVTPPPKAKPTFGEIAGRVVDADSDMPLPGSHVRLEPGGFTVHTDTKGRFRFDHVPLGDHSVVIDATAEHQGQRLLVSVGAGESTELLLVLPAASVAGGGRTVVRAPDSPPPTAGRQVISSRQIRAASAKSGADLVKLVGGITVVQHGTEGKAYQFFVRGFDAAHGSDIEVKVEGIPLGELSNVHANGYLDLDFILPELVERLDVTKGAFALDQGQFATAATIRYRLGVAEADRGFRASYEFGSSMRHRLFVGYASKDGAHIGGIEAMMDDGTAHPASVRRRARRVSGMTRVTLLDKDSVGRLELMASAYVADFQLPGVLVSSDVASGDVSRYHSYENRDRGLSGRGLLSLRFVRDTDDYQLSAQVYGGLRRLALRENFTGYLIDSVNGDAAIQEQWTGTFGVNARYAPKLLPNLRLVTELGLHSDRIDQQQFAVDARDTRLRAERSLLGWQHLVHGGLGVRWRPLDWLRIRAGLRLTVATYAADDALNQAEGAETLWNIAPRVVVAASVADGLTVSAAYGRGFRAPEIRSVVDGGAKVESGELDAYRGGAPEMTIADSVELGLVYQPAAWLRVSLTGFGTFIDRESLFDHVSGVNLERNATRRLGASLSLTVRPAEWLQLRGDVTVVDARFVDSGERVPNVPKVVGQAQVSVVHPVGLRFGVSLLGLADRSLSLGAQGSDLVSASLSMSYRNGPFEIGLVVDNLTDAANNEGEYHFASRWDRDAPRSLLPKTHIVAAQPWTIRSKISVTY